MKPLLIAAALAARDAPAVAEPSYNPNFYNQFSTLGPAHPRNSNIKGLTLSDPEVVADGVQRDFVDAEAHILSSLTTFETA